MRRGAWDWRVNSSLLYDSAAFFLSVCIRVIRG
jgi:hypothetical protein